MAREVLGDFRPPHLLRRRGLLLPGSMGAYMTAQAWAAIGLAVIEAEILLTAILLWRIH
jgi:hypothetical protein